ncbi:MAG: DUF1573 domain-containing protein [Planctomycetaceae bacterium]|nr:DUF1573 domain-containing protein [Planctomycetaceae bacterium]
MRNIRILFQFSLLILSAQTFASEESHTMPSCGAASTYAFLRLHGHDVNVVEVEGWYDDELLSLSELRRVMFDHGISTKAVKIVEPNGRTVITPAILYVTVSKQKEIGHFVVLERADSESAWIIDASLPETRARTEVTWEQLRSRWSGECLVLDDDRNLLHQPLLTGVLLLVALALLGSLSFRRTKKVSAVVPSILLVSFSFGAVGCGRGQMADVPGESGQLHGQVLECEEPTIDLGVVRVDDSTIEQNFVVKSIADHPLRIQDIWLSCCGTVSSSHDSLLARTIQPGESFTVSVPLRTHIVGETQNKMKITPDSGNTITLELNAVISKSPVIVPVRISANAGQAIEVPLKVSHVRRFSEPPLELDDVEAQMLSPFTISGVSSKSDPYPSYPKQESSPRFDELTLGLSVDDLPIGTHEFPISLKVKGWPEPFETTIEVYVKHAFEPLERRLFLGVVEPESKKPFQIRFMKTLDESGLVVETEGPLECGIDDDLRSLSGECSVPAQSGRFEGAVVLSFHEDVHPKLRIPVTGIVKSTGNMGDRPPFPEGGN